VADSPGTVGATSAATPPPPGTRVARRAPEPPISRKCRIDRRGDAWHRVDIYCSVALARTRVRVLGVLDTHAVEAVYDAIAIAEGEEHALTIEVHEVTSVTPQALRALLTRDRARNASTRERSPSPWTTRGAPGDGALSGAQGYRRRRA
jgi:hypothetical protein